MKTALLVTVCLAAGMAHAADAPFVGVELREVSDDLAAYLGLDGGALVGAVIPDSPAAEAGLQPSDIIVKWNDKNVAGPTAVVEYVRASKSGEAVTLKVVRKGKELSLTVTPRSKGDQADEKKPVTTDAPETPEAPATGFLGIAFDAVPLWLHRYLELGDTPGVSVVHVVPDSPAANAGMKPRDIIRTVNGTPAGTIESFHALMQSFRVGDRVTIEGIRAGHDFKVEVTLGTRPAQLENRLQMMPPGWQHPMPPDGEVFKDVYKFRFKDPSGKDHVFELPPMRFGKEFSFELPHIEWPPSLNKDQIAEIRKRIEEAMKKAHSQLDMQTEGLREKHEKFLEKLREKQQDQPDGAAVGAPGDDAHTVVVRKESSMILSNDGVHEITIRTEDGAKTVTVKKGDEVLVKDLPFEKVDSSDALSEELRAKIKEMDGSVMIQMKSRGLSVPPKAKDLEIDVPTRKI